MNLTNSVLVCVCVGGGGVRRGGLEGWEGVGGGGGGVCVCVWVGGCVRRGGGWRVGRGLVVVVVVCVCVCGWVGV